ncbi:methyl-accepting chemotaxis protein [Cytobacillus gottheilii]|uniref:HAMP domain-containing protein n=1 Tax=Cytobacillus gottheilii TaxID=859144 RepID=A0ABX8F8Q9_9BACI|nr:methyl-accepting chemotaxis protein [Cytobacillus gottheilii]QVY60721.1 HAMP domain-containing protein [Cytobacillus gottheilii]
MKTIRAKLSFLLYMTIGGLVLLLAFIILLNTVQESSRDQEQLLQETVSSSKEIKYNMAMTRKYEQQFLRAPDQSSVDLVAQTIVRVKAEAERLGKLQDNKEIKEQFDSVALISDTYMKLFTELSGMYEQIGYNNQHGLKGQIESNAKQITSLTQFMNNPVIDEQLLQMRMYEKQYLAAREEDSFQSFSETGSNLQSIIDRDEDIEASSKDYLTRRLSDYQNALTTIHSSYQQTGEFIAQFDGQANAIEQAIAEAEQAVLSNQQTLVSDINKQNELINWIIYGISFVLVLALSLIGIYLMRNITSSISSLKAGAEKIGNGNLAYRVPFKGSDELSLLAQTFNGMAEKVQKSFFQILDSSTQLQASSQHLAAISEETTAQANEVDSAIKQIAIGAEEQSVQLEDSRAEIERVSSAIKRTEKLSSEISADADLTEKQGQQGLHTARDLQEVSDQFLLLSNHLIEKVSEASAHTSNITSIVDTIQDIAESTNLLALNAAIEAARAGDSGKGFAVVAAEVKKLAERSKTEAQTIHQLIISMNQKMDQLLQESEKFNDYKTRQGEAVQSTKTAFESIVLHVHSISGKTKTIESAVKEVQNSNHLLTNRIEGVFLVSHTSAATAEEVAASSETQLDAISKVNLAAVELSQIASDLQQEVSLFSLEESAVEEGGKKEKKKRGVRLKFPKLKMNVKRRIKK